MAKEPKESKSGDKSNGKTPQTVRFVTNVSEELADWIKKEAAARELTEAAFIRSVLSEKRHAEIADLGAGVEQA